MSFPVLPGNNVTPLRYNSHDDVRMRLRRTFIRYKDVPVWVDDNDGDRLLVIDVLGLLGAAREVYSVSASNEYLDISSPPVGWVSLGNNPSNVFLARTPNNYQKQGLCPNQLAYFTYQDGQVKGASGYFRYEGLTELAKIAESISNRFSKVSDVLKAGSPRPIHRDWLIGPLSKTIWCVYHRTRPVGLLYKDKSTVVVGAQWGTKALLHELKSILYEQGENYVVKTQS